MRLVKNQRARLVGGTGGRSEVYQAMRGGAVSQRVRDTSHAAFSKGAPRMLTPTIPKPKNPKPRLD